MSDSAAPWTAAHQASLSITSSRGLLTLMSTELVCACWARASFLPLCSTLCDAMGHSQPDSSIDGILQARILEWVAMPFSRESYRPRDWSHISCHLHWQASSLVPPGTSKMFSEQVSSQVFKRWWSNVLWLRWSFFCFGRDCFLYTLSLSLSRKKKILNISWKELTARGRSTETTNGEKEEPNH